MDERGSPANPLSLAQWASNGPPHLNGQSKSPTRRHIQPNVPRPPERSPPPPPSFGTGGSITNHGPWSGMDSSITAPTGHSAKGPPTTAKDGYLDGGGLTDWPWSSLSGAGLASGWGWRCGLAG